MPKVRHCLARVSLLWILNLHTPTYMNIVFKLTVYDPVRLDNILVCSQYIIISIYKALSIGLPDVMFVEF